MKINVEGLRAKILLDRAIAGRFSVARPTRGKKNQLTGVSDALSRSLS
jgi:hypothetical protein